MIRTLSIPRKRFSEHLIIRLDTPQIIFDIVEPLSWLDHASLLCTPRWHRYLKFSLSMCLWGAIIAQVSSAHWTQICYTIFLCRSIQLWRKMLNKYNSMLSKTCHFLRWSSFPLCPLKYWPDIPHLYPSLSFINTFGTNKYVVKRF